MLEKIDFPHTDNLVIRFNIVNRIPRCMLIDLEVDVFNLYVRAFEEMGLLS